MQTEFRLSDLGENLRGTIPACFGSMTLLEGKFALQNAGVTGTIPSSLSWLTWLTGEVTIAGACLRACVVDGGCLCVFARVAA